MAYQNSLKASDNFSILYAHVFLCIFLNGPVSLGLTVNFHCALSALSQYSIYFACRWNIVNAEGMQICFTFEKQLK